MSHLFIFNQRFHDPFFSTPTSLPIKLTMISPVSSINSNAVHHVLGPWPSPHRVKWILEVDYLLNRPPRSVPKIAGDCLPDIADTKCGNCFASSVRREKFNSRWTDDLSDVGTFVGVAWVDVLGLDRQGTGMWRLGIRCWYHEIERMVRHFSVAAVINV